MVATDPDSTSSEARSYGRESSRVPPRVDESTEVPRPDFTLVGRLNFIWLGTLVVIVVSGDATATSRDPGLWSSWRGPAIAVLSLTMVAWYLPVLLRVLQPRGNGRRYAWQLDDRGMVYWLGVGFVLVALLLIFNRSFVGLTYALMGASVFLPLPRALLPVGAAVLMNMWALGLLPPPAGQSWSDTAGGLFTTVMSIVLVYALSTLIRERVRREQLFAELSDAHRRLRLAAARESDAATLRERNRLAREMHDSLGHALVSIAIKLEGVRLLYPVNAQRAETQLEETTQLVRATMTDLRHSLAGLRPPALEERSLPCALAELAEQLNRTDGLTADCSIDADAATLDRRVQETLYRIGQEALTNVAKHARATRVSLSLKVSSADALLEVGDNGVGLETAPRHGPGQFGVRGMRERVEALGGAFTLGPRPEGGTLLRARVPLAADV